MRLFFDFIGATADGVCAIDGQQRIVLWNAAAEALMGFGADEVRGRPCYEVFGGKDREGCRVCQHRCRTVDKAFRVELVATRDLVVQTKTRRKLRLNVSTVLVPSSWWSAAVLVHLFRDVGRPAELAHTDAGLPVRPTVATPDIPAVPSSPLTSREHEVLCVLAQGTSTREIADRLFISSATVRNHIHSILSKLGARSRLEAVTHALRHRLL